jgi:RsmE family RNA methyltransferase
VNLLLFDQRERLDAQRVRITGRRVTHMLQVHGASVGSSLRVGEIGGLMGTATVEKLSADEAIINTELSQAPPEKLPVTLILALPRPKMLRRILRSVAEFGVRELHLINSYRVEKSYWQTPVLEQHNLREHLLAGLEQAMDTRLPCVHLHRRFKPWVEDELPLLKMDKTLLLCHPGHYPACPRELDDDTLIAVGPEGGFIPYEVEQLQAAGAKTVTLGARILRVENAVSLLLGRLV